MSCIRCGAYLSSEQFECPRCGYAVPGRTQPVLVPAPVSAEGGPVALPRTSSLPAQPMGPPAPAPLAPPRPPPGQSPGSASDWESATATPFLFAGDWYIRGPAGAVAKWDASGEAWAWQQAARLPFFMRRPRFTSLQQPALWLYVAFAGLMLATVVAIVADIQHVDVLQRIEAGRSVPVTDADRSDAFFGLGKGLQATAILVLAPLFVWWTRRATANVASLGVKNPRFGTRAAVLWWFVPIAMLIVPFRVVGEAWRASDQSLALDESAQLAGRPLSPLLWGWWLVYVATNWGWSFVFQLREGAKDAHMIVNLTRATVAVDVALLPAAALAVLVVAALTKRQDAANARFNIPSGLDRLPPPPSR